MVRSSPAARRHGAVARYAKLALRPRTLLVAAVAVGTTGLLMACSSPSTSDPAPGASQSPPATGQQSPDAASSSQAPATNPSAPTQTQPPSTTRPPSSAPSSAPSAAPTGAAGLAACRSSSLSISLNVAQASGAAGSVYYPINFKNTSGQACEMYGYPGVSFVTAGTSAGRQIGAAAARSRDFPKVSVRLAPGGTAHAWLQVTVAANYSASACQPVTAHWLRIYPPNETAAGYLGHDFNACSSSSTPLLTILPVRSGLGLAGVAP
jgi:hypothetical protein